MTTGSQVPEDTVTQVRSSLEAAYGPMQARPFNPQCPDAVDPNGLGLGCASNKPAPPSFFGTWTWIDGTARGVIGVASVSFACGVLNVDWLDRAWLQASE
jgi:hypothetical protein